MKTLELTESIIWFEDPGWYCMYNDKKIKLGLICEAIDMRTVDSKYDNKKYHVTIYCSIMVQPKSLHKRYKKEVTDSSDGYCTPLDAYLYDGGIPVNIEGIESKAKTSVKSKLDKVKRKWFKNIGDAVQYVEDIYGNNASALFMMVGFYLDQNVNLIGWTGWDIIEHQVLGHELNW